MFSPCAKIASQVCASACCAAPLYPSDVLPDHSNQSATVSRFSSSTTTTTTTRSARSNFTKSTASSLFPNTYFTNHESLPDLPDAFTAFTAAFPKYSDTHLADRIREYEYPHLPDHVSLDYAGLGLFSHAQMRSAVASSSASSTPHLQPPYFDISYKSANLNTQVRYGCEETAVESAIRKRIMSFLHILGDEYTMVCTANRTTAFKLLAESYPFHSHKRLLTVYDHDSDAAGVMGESARRRGAKVMSATFSWPSLRIHTAKLKKMVRTRHKKHRGMFVFPLQSRVTGARYPYMWMSMAQENGWHVALDASALEPKDMDTLGLSLIQPDFIICSFFKVFGEDPSGFAGLFIKRSGATVLESSAIATSIGVVSIVPSRRLSQVPYDYSGTDSDVQVQLPRSRSEKEDMEISRSFSGPVHCDGTDDKQNEAQITEKDRSPELSTGVKEAPSSEIVKLESGNSFQENKGGFNAREAAGNGLEIECRGLDHADSMGLLLISTRLRYLTNWLVIVLLKLRHPHSENSQSLVKIYGPKVKFDRAPSLAFNIYDWKGEKVEPAFVQKLADRSNISLSCGFLHNILFSDKYEEQKDTILERRVPETSVGNRKKENSDLGINVVSVSLGFLTNFEDAYRLWAFVAKFLDADFVEKERWRYIALNQKMVEV